MRKDTPGWSVFQRADGSWVLKYEAAPQQWKQHRLAATTERKAKQEARTWLATNRAAGTLPGVTRTVRELSAQWIKLRAASPKLATSTIRDNESQMKNHIVSRLGDIGVGDLTPAMLREFVRGHRDAVSPNTLRNIMATLSAFYDDCRAEGWVDAAENIVRHPAVLREMPTIRNQREEVVWLPLADVQLLIGDEIVQLDRRVLYAVAFTSGLRSGELFGLKWCEVELDVEVPSMSVTQALALKGDPDKWIGMAKPKTHKSQRVVPLHRAALGALRWWLDEGWELWTGRRPGPADHVFPSPHGKPWRPKGAKRIREDLRAVGRSGQSAKGNPVDFHASRRSFLTWLKEAGVDDLYRKRLAGHSDSSVTNTSYTGAELRLLRDVVNRIALEWRNARPEPPPNDPNRAMVRTRCGRTKNETEGSIGASKAEPKQVDTQPAPVAQWIEQRFPNRLVGNAKPLNLKGLATLPDETCTTGNRTDSDVERQRLDRAAQFDGDRVSRRAVRVAHQRLKEDKLQSLFDLGVRIALGETSVPEDKRPAEMRKVLAEITDLQKGRGAA